MSCARVELWGAVATSTIMMRKTVRLPMRWLEYCRKSQTSQVRAEGRSAVGLAGLASGTVRLRGRGLRDRHCLAITNTIESCKH